MPEKRTLERAARDRRQGKAPSTQAGEFVREEIEHVREGKHGARSPEQAIAIGLSKARRAGVPLPPPPAGTKAAKSATATPSKRPPSPRRAKAAERALKREPRGTTSTAALSAHARRAASRRKRPGR